MAPKERDLMFIGGGVGNVWNQKCEEDLFYSGYGKTTINQTILTYYRFERIVEDLAEYSQELILTSSNNNKNKNRTQMFKDFTDQFKPGGVIDIAFKTQKLLP